MRLFYKRKLFWLLFGVPNLLSLWYFGAIASPQYVSRSSLIVYQSEPATSGSGGMPFGQNSGLSLEGDYLLQNFITSWQCFKTLDLAGLHKSWSSGDFVTGFGGIASLFKTDTTSLYDYYLSHVRVQIDANSAIVTVRVAGYSPDFVLKLNQEILEQSNKAISDLNVQAYQNAQALFQNHLEAEKSTLQAAIMADGNIQKESEAYKTDLTLIDQLILKKTMMEAELSVFKNDSSDAGAVQGRLADLNKINDEIGALSLKLQAEANHSNPNGEDLIYNQELVQNSTENLLGLEKQFVTAQEVALQHQYFMEYVSRPSVPPNPTSPKTLQWILGIMAATFLIYLIVKPSS